MKICLLCDTHYGIKSDSQFILDNNRVFFEKVFFPYLKEHDITIVVHLGDLVDRRKYINFNTAKHLRTEFIEPMMRQNINFHFILGNHDCVYKSNLDVSVASEMLYEWCAAKLGGSFHVYKSAEEVVFDGLLIAFVPWICEDNRKQTLEFINNTKSKILFGHLELQGYEMYRGVVSLHGEDPTLFSKFDMVCTGHFHHKSTINNVHYLGAFSEFNWFDCGDERGFHVFDTETRSLEFIPNPYPLYVKLFYDDRNSLFREIDFGILKNKFIKIIVQHISDANQYEWFLGRIEESGPADMTIVQDHLNMDQKEDESFVDETQDTLSLIREYARSTNTNVNMAKLDNLLVKTYHEAMSIE